jgi:hypothetical protein
MSVDGMHESYVRHDFYHFLLSPALPRWATRFRACGARFHAVSSTFGVRQKIVPRSLKPTRHDRDANLTYDEANRPALAKSRLERGTPDADFGGVVRASFHASDGSVARGDKNKDFRRRLEGRPHYPNSEGAPLQNVTLDGLLQRPLEPFRIRFLSHIQN